MCQKTPQKCVFIENHTKKSFELYMYCQDFATDLCFLMNIVRCWLQYRLNGAVRCLIVNIVNFRCGNYTLAFSKMFHTTLKTMAVHSCMSPWPCRHRHSFTNPAVNALTSSNGGCLSDCLLTDISLR